MGHDWIRLTTPNGRALAVRADTVLAVYDTGEAREVVTSYLTATGGCLLAATSLDEVLAMLGVGPAAPAASVRSDEEEAVDILRRAGWEGARVSVGWLLYDERDVAIGTYYVFGPRPCNGPIAYRDDRTLTACARFIVRHAVARDCAPDLDAARAMVAAWGAE